MQNLGKYLVQGIGNETLRTLYTKENVFLMLIIGKLESFLQTKFLYFFCLFPKLTDGLF